MPCKFCEMDYYIPPCKSDGILTVENVTDERVMLFTKISQNGIKLELVEEMSLQYKMQQEDCPCKECLVKIICNEAITCEPYCKFIDYILFIRKRH